MKHFMLFCVGLGVLMFLAKLFGIINTSWILVLSPVWGFIGFIGVLGFLAVLGGFCTAIFKLILSLRTHRQLQKRLDSLQSQEA